MESRRGFLKSAGAGIAATGMSFQTSAQAAPLTEKEKLARIASNTWPIRYIFKSRTGFGNNPRNQELKKKYGEITMMDFPQFTKDTFPGVTHMDLFSGLFGDITDDSMYVSVPLMVGAATRVTQEFDPSSTAGKGWLEKMAGQMGYEQVTVKNLKVAFVDTELGVIGVTGAVPGPKKGIVIIKEAK